MADDSREIPLIGGGYAYVDAADYDWLRQWQWRAVRTPHGQTYAQSSEKIDGRWHAIAMHRLIMGLTTGDPREIDHINPIGFDNRRCNLRICTRSENARNVFKKSQTPGRTGVTKMHNRYRARIACNGQHHYLGLFRTAEEAARAYDEAARRLHGEFAVLNFPDERHG